MEHVVDDGVPAVIGDGTGGATAAMPLREGVRADPDPGREERRSVCWCALLLSVFFFDETYLYLDQKEIFSPFLVAV